MTENTGLEATTTEESPAPLPATPESNSDAAGLPLGDPVHSYLLIEGGVPKIWVHQYVDDIQVTQTIDSFLKFCQDMGWTIEILGK